MIENIGLLEMDFFNINRLIWKYFHERIDNYEKDSMIDSVEKVNRDHAIISKRDKLTISGQ